jgi:hypothetical protein
MIKELILILVGKVWSLCGLVKRGFGDMDPYHSCMKNFG